MGGVHRRRLLVLQFSTLAAMSATAVALLARVLWGIHPLPELILGRVVQLLPVPFFAWGIRTMGGNAKPLLFGGLMLLETGVLIALGYLWLRREWKFSTAVLLGLVGGVYAIAGAVLMPLAGLGPFALRSPGGQAFSALGPLLTYVLWGAGLYGGRRLLDHDSRDLDRTRRAFVLGGATWSVLAVAGLAGSVWAVLGRLTVTRLGATAGRTDEVTPAEQFYVVSKNVLDPTLDAGAWRLHVDGSVEQPLTLTLEDLRALPATEQWATMECISNPVGGNLIGNALWRGVRLAEVLGRARVRDGAYDVVTMCADGYTESLDITTAMSPDSLLVYEMNGEAITPKHGAPVRLQAPGLYGLKSSKWVERIRVVDENYRGYWQKESGWTDLGAVHTECRIDWPPDGNVAREGMLLTGIAYTGRRGVSRVEVSVNGGETWEVAAVDPPLGDLTWHLWSYSWRPLAPGPYAVMARAYDDEDIAQADTQRLPQAAVSSPEDAVVTGAVGIHQLKLTVLEG